MTQQSIDPREVINNFPFTEFRTHQKRIINEITEAFNSGIRWILLEAPTGFGKSPVNIAFCRILKSFYTSPQNILLDQIKNDFGDLALIKGRKHYPCVEEYLKNCDVGPCKRNRNYLCEDKYEKCRYWQAKIYAINSQTALTNFSYLIVENLSKGSQKFPKFGNRKLLVIDEGHDIDKHVLNYTSIIISRQTLPPYIFDVIKEILLILPPRLDTEQINNLLDETVHRCQDYLERLEMAIDLNNEQIRDQAQVRRFIENYKFYKKNLDAEWIGQINKKVYTKGTWIRAQIQPIYVKNFMQNFLWKRADRFIISSATIFWYNFVKECGLTEHADETCHITVPSTFPISNRKIIDASIGSLSWNHRQENLPETLDIIDQILNIEQGKGIIHAHSYAFADAIKKISSPRLMYHTSGINRDKTLEEFLNSPPESGKVFVTVAMTEGLDLKGDKASFQILFKCPFANYAEDLRIYRRLKELHHNRWYGIQTLKTIIQAYGRAVRSITDKANFYIVDSDVIRECGRWRNQLPIFFREAYDARERF